MSIVLGGVLVAMLGLAAGSFLNVCLDRLPTGRSLIRPRSRCDACGVTLAPRDLVPLASYVLLRGKCRHCSAPIPLRVPLMEAGAGLAFAALWALALSV